jgi:hypothetical protein
MANPKDPFWIEKYGQIMRSIAELCYTSTMTAFIRATLNPAGYHGYVFPPPFFEGWYFKLVDPSERHKWAIIPGIFKGRSRDETHAFIQVLDGSIGQAYYKAFPVNEFEASRTGFNLRIGENHFSTERIHLNLETGGRQLRGNIQFADPGVQPWPVSLLSPGIMGWYAWIPSMECYHGVLSLDHGLVGEMDIDGQAVVFDRGRGYIEKDWGKSFPSAWIWFQSNHFGRVGTCVTASVANIPWMGSSFTGFIVGVWHDGKLYRFTTYRGSKMEMLRVNDRQVDWHLANRDSQLELRAFRAEGDLLRAPTPAGMDRRIAETLDGVVEMRLRVKGQVVYEGVGRNAGLEVVGNLPSVD